MNPFKALAELLEAIFKEPTLARLLALVAMIALFGFAFLVVDWRTSYFELSTLDKATTLLARLDKMHHRAALAKDPELQAAYGALKARLNDLLTPGEPRWQPPGPGALKWLAGAAPWLLTSLIFLPGFLRGDKQASNSFGGAFMCGIVFGTLSMLLPDSLSPKAIIYTSTGTYVAVLTAAAIWQRRQQAKSA